MRTLRINEALREALLQEMESDESVFLFGEDIGPYGGLFGVTEGLQEKFGAERVFDTPIAEAGFSGMGVGAALMGMRPVVELQFTGLVTVTMDPIVNSAAKGRYVHDGALNVPIVFRTVHFPGNVYTNQPLEAWFAHVPGLKVVAPSTPYDCKGLLISAIRDPDPVVFVEHIDLYEASGQVPEEPYTVPLGKAAMRRQGTDVTVVSWLTMAPIVEEAAEELAAEGISVEVIDLRSLVPFDKDAVVGSVSKTGRLVIAHEAVRRVGFGAEVAATVADSDAFPLLKAPIIRVANVGVPGAYNKELAQHVTPGKEEVIKAIRRSVKYR